MHTIKNQSDSLAGVRVLQWPSRAVVRSIVLDIALGLDRCARWRERLGLLHRRKHVVPVPRSRTDTVTGFARDHARPQVHLDL